MADSQLKAFNVMMNSGTASAENIKQALINMADKIYASGDAAKLHGMKLIFSKWTSIIR
jgi:hypothetical protein